MLLTVEHLQLTFDRKPLYVDASFRILPKEKIGLIGANGVGKTTLIEILSGKIIPDGGRIEFAPQIKVGYLDQQAKVDKSLTIQKYLESAFKPLWEIYDQLNAALARINQTKDKQEQMRLAKTSANLRDELEVKGFYTIASDIAKVASGLGITNYGMNTPLGKLSGGQKVKVILAKLLLEQPDLIILDEPTNFLDTVHVDWLVKYLKEYKGAFLIVSHHQGFLNEVVNVIMEIENGQIIRYRGNYQSYLRQKALRVDEYAQKYEAQQKEIKKLEDYIGKNKVRASTASLAKSRQKKLDKIERLAPPSSKPTPLHLDFRYKPISSHQLLVVDNLEIGYYYSLLPPMSFMLKSGEKLAVTGFNGIGKTTLLKTLIEEIPSIKGRFKFVDDVKIAYFAQEHTWDNPKLSPMEIISERWPLMDHKTIRSNLARCGITGGLALQPISTLSGGEQAKVKLCIMMLMEANVLILDEPTNHLDAVSKESLKQALKKYPGTVIVVSHEREFITDVATRIFNIEDLLSS